MNHAYRFVCMAGLVIGCAVGAQAQLLGRGGVVGGATGTVGGAVNGTVSPNGAVGAVGGVTEGTRGEAGATTGAADAVTTMRQNAALSSSAQPLLPKGMDASQAAAGFENTNQFMTTLHAAHNMNIPFDQLKSQTTGKGHTSLEKASQQLRPDMDEKSVKENLKLAEKQSSRDMVQASTPAGKDKVASKFASNSELSSRASTILPPGSNVASAATGFHDEDQFLATAQASHNLNVPFADMKDRVTAGQSLSDAIHAMKPEMSESEARAGAQTATTQAAQLRAGNSRANANASADAAASKSGTSAEAGADARTRANVQQ